MMVEKISHLEIKKDLLNRLKMIFDKFGNPLKYKQQGELCLDFGRSAIQRKYELQLQLNALDEKVTANVSQQVEKSNNQDKTASLSLLCGTTDSVSSNINSTSKVEFIDIEETPGLPLEEDYSVDGQLIDGNEDSFPFLDCFQ